MPCSFEIVRLSTGDLARAREMNTLFAQVFDDAQSYASAPPDDEWLSGLLEMPHVAALVAIDGEEMIGALVAYELEKFEQRRREYYIYDLAVLASRRREGVATSLIAGLQDIAHSRGAWAIYVQADYGDEPAVALYTRLGVREDVMHFDISPGDSLQLRRQVKS